VAIATFGVATADVERRLKPFVFDASSNPTADDVTTFILEVASEVNGALQALGFAPSDIASATEPRTYTLVAKIIADGAAATTYRAMTARDPAYSMTLDRAYRDSLNRLIAHPEMLSDAYSKTSTPGAWRSFITDTVIDDGEGVLKDNDWVPKFRVGRNPTEF
jgi:hypothetical protein